MIHSMPIQKAHPKEEKITKLNDKIVRMEGRLLDFEKSQKVLMESVQKALMKSVHKEISKSIQAVQDLKQFIENLQQN